MTELNHESYTSKLASHRSVAWLNGVELGIGIANQLNYSSVGLKPPDTKKANAHSLTAVAVIGMGVPEDQRTKEALFTGARIGIDFIFDEPAERVAA